MQGDVVKALRIIAERKGWDPTKIDGKPIEVGLNIRDPGEAGDVSLSPFVGPSVEGYSDNPVLKAEVDWSHPEFTDGNIGQPRKDSDPYPGKPL